ncbi:GH92 family glycosyl hydrolase [Amycolatopsis nigrescens]|uniref:GH92 family glycosyl hydrolase n=1 Tax=Amycolatopsis nigrescens TaxID=381445 RepID=UPI000367B12E|nr:GH92 family glycosyl hydrolase [Amycolatopsis nigrescens]
MTGNQFFSSFEEGDPQPRPSDGAKVGPGPDRSPTAKTGAGFTGLRALRFAADGYSRTVLFDVHLPITERTELSYAVLPSSDDTPSYRSTYVAVDIEFDDGSTLSGLGGTDQHGFALTALAQGKAKKLYLDQWNLVRADLGAIAAGRTARTIVLSTDPPEGQGQATGWLDDVRIAVRPPRPSTDPVDWVRTTRGTHSSKDFSRGNTIPATAVPHGFNFWTPVTDAASTTWLYEYHRRNDAANRPALEAFAVSHQPSPWMGDRHPFQLLPGIGPVATGRRQRALPFAHEDETDRPHHYGVRFANGISTDIAPSDHAAIFRFRFPSAPGWVLFDNAGNRGGLRLDRVTGTVHGHTWVRSRLSTGARRMFVYGEFDRPAIDGGRLRRPPWRRVTGHLVFDAPEVTLRIATSLISLAQARRNLTLEIPRGTSFDEVRERARRDWQDVLGRIELEGASDDQRTTFYSNLYRLFLYPNSGHENTGTVEQPRYRHASPVIRRRWPSTRRRTGAKVVDGRISVNNGFWDTYRTTWPAYALLTPARCGELIDGFVQQYREGGWISRWSSPGYANLMTGTSSDVAFADAYLKGVRGFDLESCYQAALRNATVSPPGRSVGRRGLHESIFLGYTPSSVPEGLSWALEGCINDFGIANLCQALFQQAAADDPRRVEYLDNARYFRQRALHYVHHFDHRVGFFQGRDSAGNWRWSPEEYDPTLWGYDYTETNGWNTAFSVPHDGHGLAGLFGGQAKLESTLDTFFATGETGTKPGSYGGVIHEMTEARDVRLGQYGHSNQPSHHIPYMYNHAGAPSKTQAIVREVLSRCYLGSEIGQGYPGDEDNGEMSAWYIFSALGIYPLGVGSPHYAIGSPLFSKATIHLENGKDLVINAPGNTAETVYVRGVAWNGVPHPDTSIPHELLVTGGVLDFDMAVTPSAWGRGSVPPALTSGDEPPCPLRDLTGHARADDGTDVSALFDDTTRTEVRFRSGTPVLECTVSDPAPVQLYTLTSGSRSGDPRSWVLEGSDDAVRWTMLDQRSEQVFRWRRQTRPFGLAEPAAYRHYRLRVTACTGRRLRLAQWELLAKVVSEKCSPDNTFHSRAEGGR